MNDSTGDSLTIERVMDILERGTLENEHGLMRWSSNYTFLVSIKEADEELTAVYKPRRGERPLWDFPDGTLCQRERAAFLTSHLLGWQIVPPTVLREGTRGIGSVQFYVDHDPDVNYFSFDETLLPQAARICAFDVLVNNADRKGGHVLVDTQGHVWGIDHGITFHSAPKLRTVIWEFAGQPISADLLQDVERLAAAVEDAGSKYRQALAELLSEREIGAFQNRIRHLLKTRKFPQPGPNGPNYPWPPV
jgi:uncharacterized repeat protein (TIGR03843 family)